ncbi:MAG: sodium:solute symporter family protein [Phycisphaeraceae bacterium]|nr:sodium:solute symporter family protein [Phycisphaeraceae bacterium]
MQQTLTLVLLGIYIGLVSLIGMIHKRGERGGSEAYFLASRKLSPVVLAITFIASWWGGGSAIDLADHAHANGINSFWIYGVPVLLSTGLMLIFAKAIRSIPCISQPQLMARRYNARAALMLTLFILIFMIIGASIQVNVIGKFFESYFQIDYKLGATIGVLAVLFYSMFGGFKGVVLTDLFQFVFFLMTGIGLLILSYQKSGGFDAVIQAAESRGQGGYTDFFHNVTANLAYVITFGTSWMIQANVWQRISAARSPNDARRMMAISFVAFIPLYLMISLTGMFASVFYDTVPAGGIIPDMVKNLSSPILSAVLFLGLCSAIMSTMDSMINTASLSLTVDIWQKYIRPEAKDKEQVWVGRISTFLVAAAALLIGTQVRSVLTISWIGSDFIATGVFVPLVLGFVWKKGGAHAAVASMIFGLIFSTYNLLVALGVQLPTAWEIASVKQAMVGMSGSLIIFVITSLLVKGDDERANAFIKQAGFSSP